MISQDDRMQVDKGEVVEWCHQHKLCITFTLSFFGVRETWRLNVRNGHRSPMFRVEAVNEVDMWRRAANEVRSRQ